MLETAKAHAVAVEGQEWNIAALTDALACQCELRPVVLERKVEAKTKGRRQAQDVRRAADQHERLADAALEVYEGELARCKQLWSSTKKSPRTSGLNTAHSRISVASLGQSRLSFCLQ